MYRPWPDRGKHRHVFPEVARPGEELQSFLMKYGLVTANVTATLKDETDYHRMLVWLDTASVRHSKERETP